jgi:hypothetical protein
MIMIRSILALLLLVLCLCTSRTLAFSAATIHRSSSSHPVRSLETRTTGDSSRPYSMSTVAPTREDVKRKQKEDGDSLGDMEENFRNAVRKQGPLEWLEDAMESREMDDPFHILLLSKTFEKPKITVPYVAGSLQYVLEMPLDEATELSRFSFENGMSCLGTWSREECLSLGRQLQVRDIVCRIVPYCEGGQRGWQAKDVGDSSNNMQDASS